jgi:hypothetical protein
MSLRLPPQRGLVRTSISKTRLRSSAQAVIVALGARLPGHDPVPPRGGRRQHSVIGQEMGPRPGHQRSQAGQEVERIEGHGSRPVLPVTPQRVDRGTHDGGGESAGPSVGRRAVHRLGSIGACFDLARLGSAGFSDTTRFVRSIKEECLDRMILFGEGHLRRALEEYLAHYHGKRNHQGLNNELIERGPMENGEVLCNQRLGGLLKYYRRAA